MKQFFEVRTRRPLNEHSEMTLSDWQDAYGRHAHVGPNPQTYYVPDFIGPGRAEIFDLADFVVTSISGGSIWLMQRAHLESLNESSPQEDLKMLPDLAVKFAVAALRDARYGLPSVFKDGWQRGYVEPTGTDTFIINMLDPDMELYEVTMKVVKVRQVFTGPEK
jgi:hypothetical protein